MYNKVLFTVIFSLFLVGCERGMSSETASHAECITGVYTGEADFQRGEFGENSYKLEVSRNLNSIIFLMTEETSQQQFCTIYEAPSFSENDNNEYSIVSDNIQHRGQIFETVELHSLTYTQEETSEELTGEEVSNCYLSNAQIHRLPIDRSGLPILETFWRGWNSPSQDLASIEKAEEAPKNFSTLQNICNSLEEVLNEEEVEEEEVVPAQQ